MAKAANKTEDTAEQTKSEQLPVAVGSNLPDYLSNDVADYAGAGMSERSQDFLLPFLYVAQSGSPQLKRQQADKYIPGLEAGDIFNTATNEFWKGGEGIIVHPAYFQPAEVAWVTRKAGGGYIGTYSPDDPIVKTVRIDPTDSRTRLLPPGEDGKARQLVETRYHFVILPDGSPAVIGFSSTGLQTSRQWMTQMRNFKTKVGGEMVSLPSWSRKWLLRTVFRTNDQGDWFQIVVQDAGWSGPEDESCRAMAREFYKQARERGGVVLGRPPEAGETVSDDDGIDHGDHGEPPI